MEQSMTPVMCQRMFAQGPGSHYIQIQEINDPHEPTPAPDAVSQLIGQIEQAFTEQRGQTTIQASELDEANPWLQRARWAEYLQGTSPDDLLSSVAQPEADAQGIEQGTRAIWEAMEELGRVSQRATARMDHLNRIEAHRIDPQRVPHQPLQAYMDEQNITRHIQPWQQILMFFTRTQVPHEWASPVYRFTTRQRRAWQVLWGLAIAAGRNQNDSQIGQYDQSQISPSHPGPSHSQGHDQGHGQGSQIGDDSPGQSHGEINPQFVLSPIQTACLDFCIELLNQRIRVDEYECALICALAVIGRDESGWRTPQSYLPILSKVTKMARFMVVNKALQLDPHASRMIQVWQGQRTHRDWEVDSPFNDPAYIYSGMDVNDVAYIYSGMGVNDVAPTHTLFAGSPSQAMQAMQATQADPPIPFTQLAGQGRSFREWLGLMMDTFMIRGTQTPMQWMLDLRTYGLELYYNSTAEGHVGWTG
ncbi:hypothetical protein PHISP_02398 [Aspergillus sp. HF37]|nr:hypothetical protein PHISP_02398 [Aspergillus sp. HF37]